MILTPHFIFGALLGHLIPNKLLALAVAFLSHYVLDAVPHWDYDVKNLKAKRWFSSVGELAEVTLDFIGGFFIVLWLGAWLDLRNILWILASGFAAILPDFLTFLMILNPENKLLKSHHWFHGKKIHWFKNKNNSLLFNISSQILIILLAIALMQR